MSRSMYGSPPNYTSSKSKVEWARELAPLGERRLKVIIDISNKCNLRCRMCHFSFDHVFHQPARHMRPELFARIAAEVLPRAHTLVLSAGNEPLMSPWFTDILKIAAQYRVPELYFLTNAQLLTEKVAEAVLDCGVTEVQISADGATKPTYEYIRRGASFERLKANLQHLSERKRALGRKLPLLQFNVVLMRSNLQELDHYVDLAEETGVEWIAARHLLQIVGLEMEQESLDHDHALANRYFRRFFERIERSTQVTVVTFPDFFDSEELLSPHQEAQNSNQQCSSEKARPFSEKAMREICRIPRNIRNLLTGRRSKRPARTLAAPFGYLDSPSGFELEAANAIELGGWALHKTGIARVSLEREPFRGEAAESINRRGLVELGNATIVNGSRPDVARNFPHYAHTWRAGWTIELRREMVSRDSSCETTVHAIAHAVTGESADIGQRKIRFAGDNAARPYLFCARPFDSVVIDSTGDVRPYADCRVEAPFGSLAAQGASFDHVWFGNDFMELRQRIIDRNPPPMCLTCAHFINRKVDDAAYFVPR
ncbi:MAG: radical SAM/SPASM domain-containing protein [Chthoniobacterales bacterium]